MGCGCTGNCEVWFSQFGKKWKFEVVSKYGTVGTGSFSAKTKASALKRLRAVGKSAARQIGCSSVKLVETKL